MNEFLPEALQPASGPCTHAQLREALQTGRVLCAPAVLCDEQHRLHVDLGCRMGLIEREQAAAGVASGQTRDLAILSCTGKNVCFCVKRLPPDGPAVLSRLAAQQKALRFLFEEKTPGDILPAVVRSNSAFGAFCDVGCGGPALMRLQSICLSRLRHSAERFAPGQKIYAVLFSMDRRSGRIALSQRELLGSFAENAARFRPGQTVAGVVRARQPYGVFISLTPNLSGLAAPDDTLQPGQPVCVFIKAIQPETLKIKLCVLHRLDSMPAQPLRYMKTEGHLDIWRYGSPELAKIITVF